VTAEETTAEKVSVSRRLAHALASLLLVFGLGEAGLRVFKPQRTGPLQFSYDPRFGSIPIPNKRGRITLPGVYAYTFTHDAKGLRKTGVIDPKAAKVRILLLGDSFTYGHGVNDDETFARQLEDGLSRGGIAAGVINAGNPGKGTDYALRFFETDGHALRPNLTILCFFPNDYKDNGKSLIYRVAEDGTISLRASSKNPYPRRAFFARSAVYSWIISWSHVANAIRGAVTRVLVASDRTQEDGENLVVTYPDQGEGWSNEQNARITKVLLDRLVTAVREAGSDFVLFYLPSADEVAQYRQTGSASKDETTLRHLAGPVQVFSLTPVLAASGAPLGQLYYDESRRGRPNGHWTRLAHKIAGEYLTGVAKARVATPP
jgi:lysophospholipase L1-like esterase